MAQASFIQLTKESKERFIAYYKSTQDTYNTTRNNQRARLEEIDKQYQREKDRTQEHRDAKAANRYGDTTRLQNVAVPVTAPQVEAAVTYQTSVFLTGEPIFSVVSSPEFMQEAMQMNSKIADDAKKGGWTRELMLFFRDGFKYNFAPLEVTWKEEVTFAVETDLERDATQGIPKEVMWSGNKIRRWDPYNTVVDPRVPPTEVYKSAEYVMHTELISRIQLKQFIAELPDRIISSIQPALESGLGSSIHTSAANRNYYIPSINPIVDEEANKAGGTNWMSWAGLPHTESNKLDYKDSYELTTLYCRVLPGEFRLPVPKKSTPRIFKLYIVNHEHIIYCEQQTNAHGYIPVFIGQPLEDGLQYQTKSLAENSVAFQEVASAYMTSILASRRRAISDRVLYDPSRISAAHINSPNPSAKIPVKPAAYGKNLSESVYAFPYREDQMAGSMQQISTLLGLANQLAGQNQATQGQFVKGNKTLQEFDTVMQNANGRDQMASILLEAQVFVPLKHILKLNVLQYQGGTTLYDRETRQVVEIDPIALRRAVLEFKVADGLLPASKILNSDAFSVALQSISSSAHLVSGYNIAPMFSYLMKTQGADLSSFEKSPEQQAYEQALGQWQQVALAAIDKGLTEDQLPPQPNPQDYGYNPQSQVPAPKETTNRMQ